eukprot:g4073.t1
MTRQSGQLQQQVRLIRQQVRLRVSCTSSEKHALLHEHVAAASVAHHPNYASLHAAINERLLERQVEVQQKQQQLVHLPRSAVMAVDGRTGEEAQRCTRMPEAPARFEGAEDPNKLWRLTSTGGSCGAQLPPDPQPQQAFLHALEQHCWLSFARLQQAFQDYLQKKGAVVDVSLLTPQNESARAVLRRIVALQDATLGELARKVDMLWARVTLWIAKLLREIEEHRIGWEAAAEEVRRLLVSSGWARETGHLQDTEKTTFAGTFVSNGSAGTTSTPRSLAQLAAERQKRLFRFFGGPMSLESALRYLPLLASDLEDKVAERQKTITASRKSAAEVEQSATLLKKSAKQLKHEVLAPLRAAFLQATGEKKKGLEMEKIIDSTKPAPEKGDDADEAARSDTAMDQEDGAQEQDPVPPEAEPAPAPADGRRVADPDAGREQDQQPKISPIMIASNTRPPHETSHLQQSHATQGQPQAQRPQPKEPPTLKKVLKAELRRIESQLCGTLSHLSAVVSAGTSTTTAPPSRDLLFESPGTLKLLRSAILRLEAEPFFKLLTAAAERRSAAATSRAALLRSSKSAGADLFRLGSRWAGGGLLGTSGAPGGLSPEPPAMRKTLSSGAQPAVKASSSHHNLLSSESARWAGGGLLGTSGAPGGLSPAPPAMRKTLSSGAQPAVKASSSHHNLLSSESAYRIRDMAAFGTELGKLLRSRAEGAEAGAANTERQEQEILYLAHWCEQGENLNALLEVYEKTRAAALLAQEAEWEKTAKVNSVEQLQQMHDHEQRDRRLRVVVELFRAKARASIAPAVRAAEKAYARFAEVAFHEKEAVKWPRELALSGKVLGGEVVLVGGTGEGGYAYGAPIAMQSVKGEEAFPFTSEDSTRTGGTRADQMMDLDEKSDVGEPGGKQGQTYGTPEKLKLPGAPQVGGSQSGALFRQVGDEQQQKKGPPTQDGKAAFWEIFGQWSARVQNKVLKEVLENLKRKWGSGQDEHVLNSQGGESNSSHPVGQREEQEKQPQPGDPAFLKELKEMVDGLYLVLRADNEHKAASEISELATEVLADLLSQLGTLARVGGPATRFHDEKNPSAAARRVTAALLSFRREHGVAPQDSARLLPGGAAPMTHFDFLAKGRGRVMQARNELTEQFLSGKIFQEVVKQSPNAAETTKTLRLFDRTLQSLDSWRPDTAYPAGTELNLLHRVRHCLQELAQTGQQFHRGGATATTTSHSSSTQEQSSCPTNSPCFFQQLWALFLEAEDALAQKVAADEHELQKGAAAAYHDGTDGQLFRNLAEFRASLILLLDESLEGSSPPAGGEGTGEAGGAPPAPPNQPFSARPPQQPAAGAAADEQHHHGCPFSEQRHTQQRAPVQPMESASGPAQCPFVVAAKEAQDLLTNVGGALAGNDPWKRSATDAALRELISITRAGCAPPPAVAAQPVEQQPEFPPCPLQRARSGNSDPASLGSSRASGRRRRRRGGGKKAQPKAEATPLLARQAQHDVERRKPKRVVDEVDRKLLETAFGADGLAAITDRKPYNLPVAARLYERLQKAGQEYTPKYWTDLADLPPADGRSLDDLLTMAQAVDAAPAASRATTNNPEATFQPDEVTATRTETATGTTSATEQLQAKEEREPELLSPLPVPVPVLPLPHVAQSLDMMVKRGAANADMQDTASTAAESVGLASPCMTSYSPCLTYSASGSTNVSPVTNPLRETPCVTPSTSRITTIEEGRAAVVGDVGAEPAQLLGKAHALTTGPLSPPPFVTQPPPPEEVAGPSQYLLPQAAGFPSDTGLLAVSLTQVSLEMSTRQFGDLRMLRVLSLMTARELTAFGRLCQHYNQLASARQQGVGHDQEHAWSPFPSEFIRLLCDANGESPSRGNSPLGSPPLRKMLDLAQPMNDDKYIPTDAEGFLKDYVPPANAARSSGAAKDIFPGDMDTGGKNHLHGLDEGGQEGNGSSCLGTRVDNNGLNGWIEESVDAVLKVVQLLSVKADLSVVEGWCNGEDETSSQMMSTSERSPASDSDEILSASNGREEQGGAVASNGGLVAAEVPLAMGRDRRLRLHLVGETVDRVRLITEQLAESGASFLSTEQEHVQRSRVQESLDASDKYVDAWSRWNLVRHRIAQQRAHAAATRRELYAAAHDLEALEEFFGNKPTLRMEESCGSTSAVEVETTGNARQWSSAYQAALLDRIGARLVRFGEQAAALVQLAARSARGDFDFLPVVRGSRNQRKTKMNVNYWESDRGNEATDRDKTPSAADTGHRQHPRTSVGASGGQTSLFQDSPTSRAPSSGEGNSNMAVDIDTQRWPPPAKIVGIVQPEDWEGLSVVDGYVRAPEPTHGLGSEHWFGPKDAPRDTLFITDPEEEVELQKRRQLAREIANIAFGAKDGDGDHQSAVNIKPPAAAPRASTWPASATSGADRVVPNPGLASSWWPSPRASTWPASTTSGADRIVPNPGLASSWWPSPPDDEFDLSRCHSGDSLPGTNSPDEGQDGHRSRSPKRPRGRGQRPRRNRRGRRSKKEQGGGAFCSDRIVVPAREPERRDENGRHIAPSWANLVRDTQQHARHYEQLLSPLRRGGDLPEPPRCNLYPVLRHWRAMRLAPFILLSAETMEDVYNQYAYVGGPLVPKSRRSLPEDQLVPTSEFQWQTVVKQLQLLPPEARHVQPIAGADDGGGSRFPEIFRKTQRAVFVPPVFLVEQVSK